MPEEIALERQRIFMETQAEISARRLQRFIGRELVVLIDEKDDDYAKARSFADAPEIDGVVHLNDAEDCVVGQYVVVRVEDADEHDLYARPVQQD